MQDNLVQITQVAPKQLSSQYSPDIFQHFPMENTRPGQEIALAAVDRAFKMAKRFVIVEAPTGTGKSPLNIAVGSWAKTLSRKNPMTQPGSYILSTQKSLVSQYMTDFEPMGLVELKGKANYWCSTHDVDCDTGSVMNSAEDQGDGRVVCDPCPYRVAKDTFISTLEGVTNFAYYLGETQYGHQLKPRTVLCVDEAHNLEAQILSFANTTITQSRADEIGLGTLPIFKSDQLGQVREWIIKEFMPKATAFMAIIQDLADEAKYGGKRNEHIQHAKKLDNYDKFNCKLNRFLNSTSMAGWLAYTEVPERSAGKRSAENSLIIRPLTATLFAEDILFSKAEMIVLTSATILDIPTFMRNLGIKSEEAVIVRLPSEFPVQNRPIYYWPAGCMSYTKKETTTPELLRRIDLLVDYYVGKKGIIHTHSYGLNKIVVDHLMAGPHRNRIITHTSISGMRDQAVMEHSERGDDTILVSPSMTEGLDLKEDLGRFGIICKIPYGALDIYTKARMKLDSSWYQLMTSLVLVQTTGRIVRSATDKGHNWILDGDFTAFLNRAKDGLPNYWLDSIVQKPDTWVPIRRPIISATEVVSTT